MLINITIIEHTKNLSQKLSQIDIILLVQKCVKNLRHKYIGVFANGFYLLFKLYRRLL